MEKFFNTAGPIQEDIHYSLNPLRRINYTEIASLIEQRKYFTLHAPRQTGKTTALLSILKAVDGEGRYRCVYFSVESAQTARGNVASGIRTIMSEFVSAAERFLPVAPPAGRVSALLNEVGEHAALGKLIEDFCLDLDKPLVLLIDEIDSLVGDTLVSVLCQLRKSYEKRPSRAPLSVLLCGVRDVRDCYIYEETGEVVTGERCFNIRSESLRLPDFSPGEIQELYELHTNATGQIFRESIYEKIWDLTRGQPWLVNALAHQATWKLPEGRDRGRPVTPPMIEEAAALLTAERGVHLDWLVNSFNEPRVSRVLSPILAGKNWSAMEEKPLPEDLRYVTDLGLVRNEDGNYVVANGIYREVLPRELSYLMEAGLTSSPTRDWYVQTDGRLDMDQALQVFQRICQEQLEGWKKGCAYRDAVFHLLMQAFLQRILNGGGLLDRHYGLGLGRVDLLIRWRYPKSALPDQQQEQRIVLELKTIRQNNPDPKQVFSEGLMQTARCASRASAGEAHLIVCDERPGWGWAEKIYDRVEQSSDGRDIHIWGV
ncbi:MAG: ATP-binding protein [Synergistaceae bacterium]|nr:ATP-binding protein [Synergistaceae bacterium]